MNLPTALKLGARDVCSVGVPRPPATCAPRTMARTKKFITRWLWIVLADFEASRCHPWLPR